MERKGREGSMWEVGLVPGCWGAGHHYRAHGQVWWDPRCKSLGIKLPHCGGYAKATRGTQSLLLGFINV